ncbi:hypothetical protein [Spirillospora sp. NPDC029432]|uniref:hypothetical protein n=1 Tax=Spirillospora sp. NPDC029432 TaxID=3154599 RepID=UPI003456A397
MKAHEQELVRMAYFVLPGKGKRVYRLAVARRIVDTTAVREPARRRTRVLRRAMRPSRRLHIGLGPWLRVMPARLPDPVLTAALSRLEAPVRVAYVLLYVCGVHRYAVRDQLVRLRVRDPWAAIEAAEGAREAGTVPAPPETAPFGPDALRPVHARPVLPVTVASALTVVLVGALVVSENDLRGPSAAAARNVRLVTAAPDAWKSAPHSLDVWPARGDLAGDGAFTGRALRAWIKETEAGRTGPPGNPQLLFAGHVDGRPTALLRRADRIARFTGPNGPMTVSAAATDPEHPVAAGNGRYLLAPWQRAETPDGGKVPVTGGLTAPAIARTRCHRGPVLHVVGDGRARTVGEFGGPRTVTLAHRPAAEAQAPERTETVAATGAAAAPRKSAAAGRPAPPVPPPAPAPATSTRKPAPEPEAAPPERPEPSPRPVAVLPRLVERLAGVRPPVSARGSAALRRRNDGGPAAEPRESRPVPVKRRSAEPRPAAAPRRPVVVREPSPPKTPNTSRPAETPKSSQSSKSSPSPKTSQTSEPRERDGRLDEAAVRTWERLACATSRPARPMTRATAWEFWSGRLPHGGGAARWVCTGMEFAGGGRAGQATLLTGREERHTGWCDDRRPVSGTWWRASEGGWYYLAAAARGLVPKADGPFRSVRVRSRLLTATAEGEGRAKPAEPVTLSARPT